MFHRQILSERILILSAMAMLLALMATACGGAAPAAVQTAAPVIQTVVVQQTVAVAQTVVVQATAAPTTAPTAAPSAPTPVAQVPADALAQKGKLLICADFPYPPQEFFDDNGNMTGLDVQVGTEIGRRLGLKTIFVNSVFDTIIAAVKGGKCDLIISAQNITADRQKAVSMIPYFQAGQSMVVLKDNPQGIKDPTDLCGKSAAAQSGTTEADYLQGNGDYKDKGLVQQCAKTGKKAVNVVVTQKDTDALQQLQANKVSAYLADSPVAAYYTVQHPDQFEVVGQLIEPVLEGISVPCGQEDCTKAPLSPLGQAVQIALKSMMADGAYTKILSQWKLENSAVKSE